MIHGMGKWVKPLVNPQIPQSTFSSSEALKSKINTEWLARNNLSNKRYVRAKAMYGRSHLLA
jgi:hypothetical protein